MTDHTENRLRHIGNLRSLVEGSKRLKKVFTTDWFEDVKALIVKARGEQSVSSKRTPPSSGICTMLCWIRSGAAFSTR